LILKINAQIFELFQNKVELAENSFNIQIKRGANTYCFFPENDNFQTCAGGWRSKFAIINLESDSYGSIISRYSYKIPFPLKCDKTLNEHQIFDFMQVDSSQTTFRLRLVGTNNCLSIVSSSFNYCTQGIVRCNTSDTNQVISLVLVPN
jgi:hypothetical protein